MSNSSDQKDCVGRAAAVLLRRPSALLTDVDGTISQVAPRPQDAIVDSEAVDALRRLTRLVDVLAAVSGRSISSLRSLIELDGLVYIGNHGLESWEDGHSVVTPDARVFLPRISATMSYLRQRLDAPGLLFEEKGATASIHYRLSPNPAAARDAILQNLAECPSARGLRISQGRKVVDLLPPIPVGKGTAVAQVVSAHALSGVVYMGDDSTDVDAFEELRRLRALGRCDSLLVAVVSPESPDDLAAGADCLLGGVEETVSFLNRTASALERAAETLRVKT